MRCPNCNAENSDSAKFCSLCLTSFEKKNEAVQQVPAPVVAPSPEAPPADSQPDQQITKTVGWTCPVCGTVNAVEADVCSACGSSLFDSLRRSEAQARKRSFEDKNALTGAALSIVPGGGHFYLGLNGDGLIRVVLFVWWLGAATILPDRSGPVAMVRVILFLGAFALMAISAIDAYRTVEAPGTAPILNRKFILYSSLTVVGLLVAGVFAAIASARS